MVRKNVSLFIALSSLLVFSFMSCRQKATLADVKHLAYRQGLQILNENAHSGIAAWTLLSIDTLDMQIYKGCFLKAGDTIFFISIAGKASASSGNANRLNLIAHQGDSLNVDCYEQGTRPDTILDFNHDGVDDLFFHEFSSAKGICLDQYRIKSYTHKHMHTLFNLLDKSTLNCGAVFDESKPGDTLAVSRIFGFSKNRKDQRYQLIVSSEFEIQSGRSYKMYGERIARDLACSHSLVKREDTLTLTNGQYDLSGHQKSVKN